jgi:hypothetical protein
MRNAAGTSDLVPFAVSREPFRGPGSGSWTKLGWASRRCLCSLTAVRRRLALDPNEKTQYRARELKSIHIATTVGQSRAGAAPHRTAQALVMKLVLHECHVNGQNLFNQARRSPHCWIASQAQAAGGAARRLASWG